MQIIKKILYKIFSLQEALLQIKLSETLNAKQLSKSKRHYSAGCVLDLNSLAEKDKTELEFEITEILAKNNYDPENLLEYIAAEGTGIYRIQNAAKLLNPVGENEGFIYPATGLKALYLSLGINKKFSLKTDEMFVVPNGMINKYYFLYHFYNWFAFKRNIFGLDLNSQELLKKYLYGRGEISDLQLADIYKLKNAIRQDKASIEFVIKLCRNSDGAKQALNKLKSEGGAQL